MFHNNISTQNNSTQNNTIENDDGKSILDYILTGILMVALVYIIFSRKFRVPDTKAVTVDHEALVWAKIKKQIENKKKTAEKQSREKINTDVQSSVKAIQLPKINENLIDKPSDSFVQRTDNEKQNEKKPLRQVASKAQSTQKIRSNLGFKQDSKRSAKIQKDIDKEVKKAKSDSVDAPDKSESKVVVKLTQSQPQVQPKIKNTIQVELKKLDEADYAAIRLHKMAIGNLHTINNNERQLSTKDANKIYPSLAFKKLASLPMEYSVRALCDDFLICSRVGIDIQLPIQSVCTEYFISALSKEEVSTLLFACFLHDANSYGDNVINMEIIKALLGRATLLFGIEAKSVEENNYEGHMMSLSLFSDQRQKYGNNTLRETKYYRFVIDAAAYYNHIFNDTCTKYLNLFVDSNDKSTISIPQHILFKYLEYRLSKYDVTIELEKKISVATYSADILIRDNSSNTWIDFEFDGQNHFYNNESGIRTMQYKREFIARDHNLLQGDVGVFRVTNNDLRFCAKTGQVQSISNRLDGLIADIENRATPINFGKNVCIPRSFQA